VRTTRQKNRDSQSTDRKGHIGDGNREVSLGDVAIWPDAASACSLKRWRDETDFEVQGLGRSRARPRLGDLHATNFITTSATRLKMTFGVTKLRTYVAHMWIV
jgi:hypothetical protein